jgi:TonB-dependent starch-binding outer membrane protein SusC
MKFKKALAGLMVMLLPLVSVCQQKIKGIVTNSSGAAVIGALVTSQRMNITTVTNNSGAFEISTGARDTLYISHVNYKLKQYVTGADIANINIVLDEAVNQLDETVVIAYGTTTRRLNTGNVGKVNAKEIERQPVNDALTTLAGRVPGVNSLSPSDIESIEVLKDADATAIYGSRGANGVVLITTKKGRAGKTRFDVDVYRSTSGVTRNINMMNTAEYLQMRREAFANDGASATTTNAPDLKAWDTTRYTDLNALTYSGNAAVVNVNASLTGGDEFTQFIVSGSYRDEKSLFERSMGQQRATSSMGLQHKSRNRKLEMSANVSFGYSKNILTTTELGLVINTVPNIPAFYDSAGKLNWQEGGMNFNNPLAYRLNKYDAQTQQLNGRVSVSYTVMKGLRLSSSIGYNNLRNDETSKNPLAAQNPLNNPLAALEIANANYSGWIAEPQVEYEQKLFGGYIKVLAGTSLQQNTSKGNYIRATGYTSDNLINSIAAAPNVASRRNNISQYRYEAVFARVNYNWQNKYLLNVSGRTDGSSRFGPGRRFSAFGAAGGAWMFSNENFFKQNRKWLSYGKLRMSYGTSGNDQISDYGYLDAWGSTNAYQGTSALYPLNLFNPDYRWEVNKKAEAAIEVGLFGDRILVTVAYYRNRSDNQLVGYKLPSQTGFNSIIQNLGALVENTGTEIELRTENIKSKAFEWNTSFNITLPRNRLLHFPDLATSSYANTYVEGESLNLIYRYQYNGVDPATGVFRFEDVNKNGGLSTADYVVSGNTDPVFYGGLQNSFHYKSFELDVFAEFKKQTGRNYLYSLYAAGNVPGMMFNLPVLARDRWQKPGDVAMMQRLTAVTTSDAYKAGNNFLLSDGVYGDASYVRIKNVSLRYHLPEKLLNKAGMQAMSIYVTAQNLFTITGYKGSDPEVQNMWQQSPLRTVAVGVWLGM